MKKHKSQLVNHNNINSDNNFLKLYIIVQGVYLSLKGIFIANASSILISDIGEGDEGALLCFTDLIQCCNSASGRVKGEWRFPDGLCVQVKGKGGDFYRNRDPGVVRLNRRNNATFPTGLYCCDVQDADSSLARTCANIGGLVCAFCLQYLSH